MQIISSLERTLFGRLPESVRYNVRVEVIASVVYGLFFAGCLSFVPVVLRRLGASTGELAAYVTLSYLGLLLAPLTMPLLRNFSPLRLASGLWIIGRAFLLLTAFITQSVWMLVLTAIYWLAESLPGPAYARIMQQAYPAVYRGRAMSGIRVWAALSVLIATPLAGWALDRVGYQVLFPIAAIFGVLSIVIFARLRIDAPPDPPGKTYGLAGLLPILRRDRTFLIYLLALACYGFGGVMPLPLYPVIQVSRLQLSYTEIGYLGLAQSLCWMLGFLVWGRLLDSRGPLWVLRLSMGIAALVPFTYIWADSAWMLLPAFIAQGVLQGGFELGATNSAMYLAGSEHVVEYTALQTAMIGLRGMIAPFIGAALLGLGVSENSVFALGTTLVLISCVIVWRIRR